jgi:hypothetical protein
MRCTARIRTEASRIFDLADALQDLLFYAKCDDLSPTTRMALTKQYRALRSVAAFYDLHQTLVFDLQPGVRFRKK